MSVRLLINFGCSFMIQFAFYGSLNMAEATYIASVEHERFDEDK